MFFTQELLSRRDSGFGLLWLAATLGAKSSFRKLPRRSVITADISELCNLIIQPGEPLALRLSSNLMVGVARVYKVKQEIFYSDVTTCFNTLKKAVQDIQAAAEQLQMAQSSVRPDIVTLSADPALAFALDFDHLFPVQEDFLRVRQPTEEQDLDPDFDPSGKKAKDKKGKGRASSVDLVGRADMSLHTLNEDHLHLLAPSADASFHQDNLLGLGLGEIGDPGTGLGMSSSQVGGFDYGYGGLDADMFEGVDIEDVLGGELGDEWRTQAQTEVSGTAQPQIGQQDVNLDLGLDIPDEFAFGGVNLSPPIGDASSIVRGSNHSVACEGETMLGENLLFSPEPLGLPNFPKQGFEVIEDAGDMENGGRKQRKPKRVKLLLDQRTELTNEEIESSRANYIEEQEKLRKEHAQKQIEKESGRKMEQMLWGAPRGVQAGELMEFWLENLRSKVQVRDNCGDTREELGEGPARKRRKLAQRRPGADVLGRGYNWERPEEDFGMGTGVEINMGDGGFDVGVGEMGGFRLQEDEDRELVSRMRSSEEPEAARRASSRPLSLLGSQFHLDDYGMPAQMQGQESLSSRKNNVLPWDNAWASSSVAGASIRAPVSDRMSFGLRRRSSTRGSNRRASSLRLDSPMPTPLLGVQESPMSFRLGSGGMEDEFQFNVGTIAPGDKETQPGENSELNVERNAFNFLEYTKMQLNAFPTETESLVFDDIVPTTTSTRHVAATAFHHCLDGVRCYNTNVNLIDPDGHFTHPAAICMPVLATKDMIGVEQQSPTGAITIRVK